MVGGAVPPRAAGAVPCRSGDPGAAQGAGAGGLLLRAVRLRAVPCPSAHPLGSGPRAGGGQIPARPHRPSLSRASGDAGRVRAAGRRPACGDRISAVEPGGVHRRGAARAAAAAARHPVSDRRRLELPVLVGQQRVRRLSARTIAVPADRVRIAARTLGRGCGDRAAGRKRCRDRLADTIAGDAGAAGNPGIHPGRAAAGAGRGSIRLVAAVPRAGIAAGLDRHRGERSVRPSRPVPGLDGVADAVPLADPGLGRHRRGCLPLSRRDLVCGLYVPRFRADGLGRGAVAPGSRASRCQAAGLPAALPGDPGGRVPAAPSGRDPGTPGGARLVRPLAGPPP